MSARPLILLTILLAGGCSATIVPPAAPPNPATIYVADYGRHSSIVLPNPSHGGWTEYAWAEWDWFANGNAHWYMIPHAMLFATEPTLGERDIPSALDEEALKKALGAASVLRIECAQRLVDSLRTRLNEQFSKNSVTLRYSSYSSMYHVKDVGGDHYWFGNNCNHETARWLEDMGCQIKGTPLMSHFKLKL